VVISPFAHAVQRDLTGAVFVLTLASCNENRKPVVTFVRMIEEPKTKRAWSPLSTLFMQPESSGLRITIKGEGPNEL
jgi:hypothetical protein